MLLNLENMAIVVKKRRVSTAQPVGGLSCFISTSNVCSFFHRFELYAVVSHTGVSLSSGHYVAFIRSPLDTKLIETIPNSSQDSIEKVLTVADSAIGPWWLVCDDDVISAIPHSELESKLESGGATTPYLLLYRRTDE